MLDFFLTKCECGCPEDHDCGLGDCVMDVVYDFQSGAVSWEDVEKVLKKEFKKARKSKTPPCLAQFDFSWSNFITSYRDDKARKKLQEEIAREEELNPQPPVGVFQFRLVDAPDMNGHLQDTDNYIGKHVIVALVPWGDDGVLAVPMMRPIYAEFASSDDELHSVSGINGAEIYQCWNSRTVDISHERWQKSMFWGYVPEEDKEALRQALLYTFIGDAPDEEILRDRMGPDITITPAELAEYKREELAFVNSIITEDMEF